MNPSEFKTIADIYLFECQELAQSARKVLKTDLWNEEAGTPLKGGIIGNLRGPSLEHVVGIEYDPSRVNYGAARLTEMQLPFKWETLIGDIRNLQFPDKFFDTLLDCSTIDHVRPIDLPVVLAGYARVLQPKGRAYIVSWTDPAFQPDDLNSGIVYCHNDQYWHSPILLEKEIKKYFKVDDYCLLARQDDGRELVRYLLTKRSGRPL